MLISSSSNGALIGNKYVSDRSTCITYKEDHVIFIRLRVRQLCITTREQSRRMKVSMNESDGVFFDSEKRIDPNGETDSKMFRSKKLGSSVLREAHRCLELLKKILPRKILFDLCLL